MRRPREEHLEKEILHGVSGLFRSGRITAIMGPSGSGKTSLLNLVAGSLRSTRGTIKGDLKINGESMSLRDKQLKRLCGYVQQDDVILPTMTVREAVTMSALLRLPKAMTLEQKMARVDEVIEMLHLTHVANSVIGGTLLKGISGGERKRVSVAMVMITNPAILYLDEPTSGLDTYNAFSLIQTLRQVAQSGRTVVATIHQPSSDTFHLFDDLLLLHEGDIVYHGPCAQMVDYFARVGYECPRHYNPADYLFMNVLNDTIGGKAHSTVASDGEILLTTQMDSSAGGSAGPTSGVGAELASHSPEPEHEPEHEHDHHDPVVVSVSARGSASKTYVPRKDLASAWTSSPEHTLFVTKEIEAVKQTGVNASDVIERAPFSTQFFLLSKRAWNNAIRNQLMVKGRLAQSVMLALICGIIYLQLSSNQRGIQDREGSLFFIAVNGMMSSAMQVLSIFGAEKAVFRREYDAKLYGLPAYFLSRTVVELPFKILFPVLGGTIMYWMIGYQATAEKYFFLVFILILIENAGTGLGVFVASFFEDIAVALTVIPIFLMPLMVFSGFMVNTKNLPVFLRWVPYISPAKYSFTALVLNEFQGKTFYCDAGELQVRNGTSICPITDGEAVIKLLGFENDGSIGFQMVILLVLFIGLNLLAYFALRRQLKKEGA